MNTAALIAYKNALKVPSNASEDVLMMLEGNAKAHGPLDEFCCATG